MRALITDNQATWDDYLSAKTLTLKRAKSRAINLSPFNLMFMHKQGIGLNILDSIRTPAQEKNEYISESLEKMHAALSLVENKLKRIGTIDSKNIHFLTKIN